MNRLLAIALVAAFTTAGLPAQNKAAPKKQPRRPNPALAPIEDVAGLPRVLLIGDSISIAYTVPVRQLLQGKANVHRPKANCGPTSTGLKAIDAWLDTGGAGEKWDVIHFNWGLHDLKYLGPNGENLQDPNDPKNHQQVAPDQYRENLTKLVKRLQKTGAHLIWRNTTPVPEGAKGRVVGHSAAYNAIATEVMEKAGVETHDLFSFAKEHASKIQKKADVHYTPEGSQLLAQEVAKVVQAALAK